MEKPQEKKRIEIVYSARPRIHSPPEKVVPLNKKVAKVIRKRKIKDDVFYIKQEKRIILRILKIIAYYLILVKRTITGKLIIKKSK